MYEAKDILILDEPSSAFDRTTAIELMETINSLENTTIIMVTHDEELIPKGFQTYTDDKHMNKATIHHRPYSCHQLNIETII